MRQALEEHDELVTTDESHKADQYDGANAEKSQ
jgi:hypothetical protein